ncbi:MAG: hypothetical protein QM724_06145 [Flavobacteriales bacterium]
MPLQFVLWHAGLPTGLGGALVYWSGCVLLAVLVLNTIELPFMRLRDRFSERIRHGAERELSPR